LRKKGALRARVTALLNPDYIDAAILQHLEKQADGYLTPREAWLCSLIFTEDIEGTHPREGKQVASG
jgi:hypothetical protein